MSFYEALLRPSLSSLRAYVPHPVPEGALRFDANESPWALSDDARRAVAEAVAAAPLHRYPDVRATRLRECVAAREGCHPDCLVFGAGSDEVIALIESALSRPREGADAAVIVSPTPGFVMYAVTAATLSLRHVGVALDADWQLDRAAMQRAVDAHRPSVIFLASPNNPTGAAFRDEDLDAVIVGAPESLVILDEAYGDFAAKNYRARFSETGHVGRLQTLSKVGFAAARCGWAVLPRGLASEVDKVRQPYNLSTLSQTVATLALTTLGAEVDAAIVRVQNERERLYKALQNIDGLRVDRSDANFLFVEAPAGEQLFTRLAARGLIVRSFHAQGGRMTHRLRITVGTPEENARLVEGLCASL
ncbi:MAG: aminotransferase class I/II-fold pyridoxal phosphate-dependent enzyme [Myxococcales bacterium]|nr:aminotransferase class I/II-fold pyridoxal phosphate-dependent enzyme [Myxococcales bacterium]